MNNDADRDEVEASFIPPGDRELARDFEDEAEAELAAGYLRAQGIPAEVGKMMIPGLQYEIALWVHKRDAHEARRLLDQADQNASATTNL
ncbi:MAG TPA: hypothetical protein VIC32_02070 [Terriglobales bacterium]|jgi:hypothetical protein